METTVKQIEKTPFTAREDIAIILISSKHYTVFSGQADEVPLLQ
ncbi:hypothetical protein OROHE_010938 [Orobanche hederae]